MVTTGRRKRPRSAVVALATLSLRVFAVNVDHSCHAFSTTPVASRRTERGNFPPAPNPAHARRMRHVATMERFTIAEDDEDSWQAGDVYRDLELLEQGIRLANADVNLLQTERLDLLRYMAQSRRPLFPDVQRYLILPLSVAMLLHRLCSLRTNVLLRFSNLQFWTSMVVAPTMLLVAKRLSKPPPEPMPKELEGLALESLSLSTATDWEPQETSCRDAVLVLLEYWTSAVLPMALLGAFRIVASTKPSFRSSIAGWTGVLQLCTRLAAVAAIHQNPEQLYQIQRPTQPRPLTFFTSLLQPLISSIMLFLPLGFTMDVYALLCDMPHEAGTALYTTLFVGTVGTFLRLKEQERCYQEDSEVPQLRILKARTRWLYALASVVIARAPLYRMLTLRGFAWPIMVEWMQQPFRETWPVFRRGLGSALLWTFMGMVSLTIPVLHLRSVARQVRVVYTHDASLAMDANEFQKATQDESRRTWRYRLEWQENPQRIGQAFSKWKSNLVYWLFFEGRAQDQLIQEQQRKLETSGSSIDWNIKDRILQEVGKGLPYVPRDEWKRNAMERVAEKHQADYDRKSFDDPLGVAVQQTLGIGLGFNFEHDKPLQKGQQPSLRRLQARVAKSAILRVQQLYDPQLAQQELAAMSDADQRNAKAKEMRKKAREEIDFLAKRMTELLPPPSDMSDAFKDRTVVKRYQQRKEPSGWVRVNSHEYRPVFDDAASAVKSVEEDIMNFHSKAKEGESSIKAKDHCISRGKSTDNSKSYELDDGFVEAFLENRRGDLPNEDEDDDYTFC